MSLYTSFCQLLQETGLSKITRSAYDTAWIARLGELDRSLGNQALNWLSNNQLPDGSWGASAPQYYHDRVICTLAAMIALTKRGQRAQDRRQIERGQNALEKLGKGATKGLTADPAGSTIGFEMIMPTLLAEAESLKIIAHQQNHILGRLTRQREAKLAALPERMINRYVTVAFSAEMAGADGLQLLDIERMQEENGSVAYSPAATAFFALYVKNDENALQYLRDISINGAVPYIGPIDVFEYAWVLWNLALTDCIDSNLLELCQPSLDGLKKYWHPGNGISAVGKLTLIDGDTTAMAYDVLAQFGQPIDLEGVLRFEKAEHFLCFPLEANPSISTNIHILGALRQAKFGAQHPSVQKVLRFLKRVQTADAFWFDKWHASPYYTTCHAIIVCVGLADETVQTAVDWVLHTQNADGSWGFYMSTAEETAYCLQSLSLWKRHGKTIPEHVLERGQCGWLIMLNNHIHPSGLVNACIAQSLLFARLF